MPELPEVESIKLQLNRFIVGHKIEEIIVNYPKIFVGDVKNIKGAKIEGIRRFAKVLSIDLSNNYSLVVQIKLTGQLIYRGPNLKSSSGLSIKVIGGIPGKHTHIIFKLDKGGILYYNDVRKFGRVMVVKRKDVEKTGLIGKLGPEVFKDLNLEEFRKIISNSKKPVKILLMDQEKMAGVGNIYANDALWLAKVGPWRIANTLLQDEQKTLFEAIEKVLNEGIKRGGASEQAFVTPDGGEGKYQDFTLVYGREDEPCKACSTPIKKIKLGGRGTYFCPVCQL